MGGEIKVLKKNGPGTLMRLHLILSTPADLDGAGKHCQFKFEEQNLTMLLALNGRMGRSIMAQWLKKNMVCTYEASEWNELTQTLQEHFKASYMHSLPSEFPECQEMDTQEISISIVMIVIDIGLLDLSTDIWKEQLSYLDNYCRRAKFAWILNHDTSNIIKAELRRRGHLLMVNRPLYKAKIIQILEDVLKDQEMELQKYVAAQKTTVIEGIVNGCHEIDAIHSCAASSDDSDTSEHDDPRFVTPFSARQTDNDHFAKASPFLNRTPNGHHVDFARVYAEENACDMKNPAQTTANEEHLPITCHKERDKVSISTSANEQKSLEGLHILLAEDNPILQRVATIMLEKLGAKVVAVGDGVQAVDALKFMLHSSDMRNESPVEDDNSEIIHLSGLSLQPYDLILMDCQMPKMDGYEATKAIRESELGTGCHIPIVALTAHAMSCDEAKCLEVGMDAYLTKPIDRKLMVATMLSLTKRDQSI